MRYEELEKKIEEEEKTLQKKYAELLKAAKKGYQREKSLIAVNRRKSENHAKYIFAGYVLEQIKSGNIAANLLDDCIKNLKKEKDKDDMLVLKDSIMSEKKLKKEPKPKEEKPSVSPEANEPQQKKNLFGR